MYKDEKVYISSKMLQALIFNDGQYEFDSKMFDVDLLVEFKNLIKWYVDNNFLNDKIKNNINYFISQARDVKDENFTERIKIINEIIRLLNSQKIDDSIFFYRYQLLKRERNINYLTCSDEQIRGQIDYVNNLICYDFLILVSHSCEVSDVEFENKFIPIFKNNYAYYLSVNIILKEYPKIIEDPNFFNRLTHILSLNSKVEMSIDYAKTHNKLLKKIYKTAKKYR